MCGLDSPSPQPQGTGLINPSPTKDRCLNAVIKTENYFWQRREYMKKEILKKQKQLTKDGYIVLPNYFLREWVKVLGVGPAMLYLYLLTYCHKGKDIAWPTISTLSKTMDLTPKTITKYRQILVKYGLIKKISKRKTSPDSYRRNIYRLSLFDMGKNTLSIGNISPYLEVKFTPDIGENLPTNNNNLNNTNTTTTTNSKKEAVAAVINFKKLKEKGDLSACNAQAEEKMQTIRERLMDLDFEGKFIEQLLKDYSLKKIEEKLDLLMEKRNIQSPAGWLISALKNDYQDPEQEKYDKEPVGQLSKNPKTPPGEEKASSREFALEMIRKTREMLANLKKKEERCNGTKRINCQG